MADFVEYSAKTKGEAITKACIELGVTSDQLEVQVVSEGSTGFFGIGSKPATILVRRMEEDSTDEEIRKIVETVSPESLKEAEKKAEEEQEKKEKQPRPKAPRAEKTEKPEKAEKREKPEKAPKPEKKEKPAEAAKEEPVKKERQKPDRSERAEKGEKGERGEKSSRPSKKQRDKGNRSASTKVVEAAPAAPAPKVEQRPIKILTNPEEIADVENRARVFLKDVFGAMELGEVEINSKYNVEEGCLDVDFEGEDMGVLIGKRGQTLDSLQYLTSLVVNKGKDDYIRVKLDTEDYRRRRKDTLENLARGIAYKVRKTRRPVVLEPMNPYERRIIHASLQSNKFVETISEGEEPYRHVVVRPIKF
ncbi:MAG: Jag N-terminal domain-containing protein [Blautia sp.]|nr:Jag N-terminal domain-containing protein [Blautia sp.]